MKPWIKGDHCNQELRAQPTESLSEAGSLKQFCPSLNILLTISYTCPTFIRNLKYLILFVLMKKMFCSQHLNLKVSNMSVLYSNGNHIKLSCCWFLINLAFLHPLSGKKIDSLSRVKPRKIIWKSDINYKLCLLISF